MAMTAGDRRGGETTLRGVRAQPPRLARDRHDAHAACASTATDGAPIATLVNYACHPTASGRGEHRDLARLVRLRRRRSRAQNSAASAIYINGAIGDVNPGARRTASRRRQLLGDAVGATRDRRRCESAETIGGAHRCAHAPARTADELRAAVQRVQDAVGRAGPALSRAEQAGGLRGASVALHAAGRGDLAQIVAALEGHVRAEA